MEQLKVKNKDILVINFVLFQFLSYLFIYLQYAYRHNLSPLSHAYLLKSFELFWHIIIPLLGCSWLVWKHHRWALKIYILCSGIISFHVIEGLFIEFNKIIAVVFFFYVVIAYFLYQIFNRYSQLAGLNTNFAQSDLFSPILTKIPCSIFIGEEGIKGYLTNWDESGCFIQLDTPLASIPSQIKVIIEFKQREFAQEGVVISHTFDSGGVGIKFEKSPKSLHAFNWNEFNDLVNELGYKPERLR